MFCSDGTNPPVHFPPYARKVNFCLTSHLGIDVPEGECWIDVGDQRREWRNGEAMLFDTSVLHRAENTADRTRYILMMRVWHPDLTEVSPFLSSLGSHEPTSWLCCGGQLSLTSGPFCFMAWYLLWECVLCASLLLLCGN